MKKYNLLVFIVCFMMYFAPYNCSGFTDNKIDYINYLLSDIHVLFLQELWLIDSHRYKLNDAF